MHTPKIDTLHRNLTKVTIGSRIYWFSYEECVAFQQTDGTRIVHRNDWSNTTGAHLNKIDGGSAAAVNRRLGPVEFQKTLDAAHI